MIPRARGSAVTRFESVLPALERVDHDRPIAGRTIDAVTSRAALLMTSRRPDPPHPHAHERKLASLSPERALQRAARTCGSFCHGHLSPSASTCRWPSSSPRAISCATRRSPTPARPARRRVRSAGSHAGCVHMEGVIADVLLNHACCRESATSSSRKYCSPPESTVLNGGRSPGADLEDHRPRAKQLRANVWIGRRHSALFPDAERRKPRSEREACGYGGGSRPAVRMPIRRRRGSTRGSHTGAPGVSRY